MRLTCTTILISLSSAVSSALSIGPPKGIEVRDLLLKSDFSWFFLNLGYFLIENNIILYGNWAGIKAGTSRFVIISFWPQNNPQKSNFGPQSSIFNCSTPLKFYFFFINPLFSPKFPDPYCRKGSYGPYGPFWFSAKSSWLSKALPTRYFLRKVQFSFYQKNEFILGR